MNEQQGINLLKSIVENAWENPEFKKHLIDNPSKTISNFTGRELNSKMTDGRELVVVDQSDEKKYYLNIPVKPQLDMLLNEKELDLVAGGGEPIRQAGQDFANWLEDRWDDVKSLFK